MSPGVQARAGTVLPPTGLSVQPVARIRLGPVVNGAEILVLGHGLPSQSGGGVAGGVGVW